MPEVRERQYRLPRGGVMAVRIFAAVGFAFTGALLVDSSTTPLWGYPVLALMSAGVLVQITPKGLRNREVREDAVGLRLGAMRPMTRSTIPWGDIERFERPRTGRMVCVVRKNGRRSPIIGFDTSGATTWEGGSTDDIVGELNRRLLLWRARIDGSTGLSMPPGGVERD